MIKPQYIHRFSAVIAALVIASGAFAAEEKAEDKNKDQHNFDVKARMQMRWVYLGSDGISDRSNSASKLAAIPDNNKTSYSEFNARRLRLGVKGDINDRYKYGLIFKGDNLIQPGKAGKGGIHEIYIGHKWNTGLEAYIGSMKIPFQRENLTSSGKLTTLERSLVTDTTGHQFDTGLNVKGRLFEKVFAYSAGIYNGNGGFGSAVNGQGNVNIGKGSERPNKSPFGALRLQVDPMGEYKEGASMFGKKTLLSFGAAVYYQDTSEQGNPFAGAGRVGQLTGITGDLGFHWNIITVEGGYTVTSATVAGQDQSMDGWYATLAVFAFKRYVQPWVQYQTFADDRVTGGLKEQNAIAGGVNIYPVNEHKYKIQAAYMFGLNDTPGGGTYGFKDDWFGVQAQVDI